MGYAVECHSEEVAKQLCKDLDEFGEEPSNPLSLVAFQYAFIDFFSKLPRQELEESVSSGLDINWDWTFSCPTATPKPLMDWIALFGTHSANAANGKNWLSTLSLTQLCAVSVLGRAIESVNIPFILATSLKPKHLSKFSAEVSKRYGTYSKEKCNAIFNKYLFYYNV